MKLKKAGMNDDLTEALKQEVARLQGDNKRLRAELAELLWAIRRHAKKTEKLIAKTTPMRRLGEEV